MSPEEASYSNLHKSIFWGLTAALSSLRTFPGESSHFVFFFWPRLPLNLNRNLCCPPSPACWPNLGRLELRLHHKHTMKKCSCIILVLSSFFLLILYFCWDASWRANLSIICFRCLILIFSSQLSVQLNPFMLMLVHWQWWCFFNSGVCPVISDQRHDDGTPLILQAAKQSKNHGPSSNSRNALEIEVHF